MTETAFFDTNVLVYLFDTREAGKRETARKPVDSYFRERRGIVSTQVLQEFFVTVTGKAIQLPVLTAARVVADYATLNVVIIEPHHILDAIDIHTRFQLSFWDGLILAAAKSAGAAVLYSEDFSHGQSYDGVEVRNPF
ncbi:MAG: PIN domain-containing protein [Acidobacteria bacterium]|nr:PIN domain-containing protein [Acidobacteriota bacterium]